MFTSVCPHSTERVCAVQGPPEVVVHALQTLLDLMHAAPVKGNVQLYDPINYDVYGVNEYGGFAGSAPPPPPHHNHRGPPGPPMRRPYGPPPPPHSRHWDHPRYPPPDEWYGPRHPPYHPPPPGTERRRSGPPMYSRQPNNWTMDGPF